MGAALLSQPVTAIVVEHATAKGWTGAVAAMQGWRKTFEDAHIFEERSSSSTSGWPSAIFAVLDGHGGCQAALRGKVLLQERLRKLLSNRMVSAEDLKNAFLAADDDLRLQLAPEDRSGSTVVAALLTQQSAAEYTVHLVHCGDSRVVVRRGQSYVCSEDHKPCRPDEEERIRAAGGSVECGALGGPSRVDGVLAVSRSLGDFPFKPIDQPPEQCKVTALPEVQTVQCSIGDWILIACDGIFDVFTNAEVQDWANAKLSESDVDMGSVVSDLLQECLKKGSKDNCTAALVRLQPSESTTACCKEMVPGSWEDAPDEVRAKYAEFFEAQGFAELADRARPVSPTRQEEPSPGSASDSPGRRQLMAVAKAVQAMRSSRTIQEAWRARRSKSSEQS